MTGVRELMKSLVISRRDQLIFMDSFPRMFDVSS